MKLGWLVSVGLLSSSVAQAQAPSPVAMGDRVMTGVMMQSVRGSGLGPDPSDLTLMVQSYLRLGLTLDRPVTRLGAQIGVEGELAAQWRSRDSETAGFGTVGRLELALRTYTFEWPLDGAVVVHTGLVGGLGKGRWRIDGGRLAPIAGVRTMFAVPGGRLELDYGFVPIWWRSRDDDTTRAEHRWLLTIGAGPVGLGVSVHALWARRGDRTRSGTAVGGLIELRR